MDLDESQSPDWKTCFKKLLDPHLLNPAERKEQDDALQALSATNGEENDTLDSNVYTKENKLNTMTFLNESEKSENVQISTSSHTIPLESIHSDNDSPSFIGTCQVSDSPDEKETDVENSVMNLVVADAEEMANRLKTVKINKNSRYFKMAESNHKTPEWKQAFKKILDPNYANESSSKSHVEVRSTWSENVCSEGWVYEQFHLSYPEFLGVQKTKPRTNSMKLEQHDTQRWVEEKESPTFSQYENCNKKHLTKEEKNALHLLNLARSFKRNPSAHINIFDGAGVNCFKDSDRKYANKSSPSVKKPVNVPPPGGWVCIKPFTNEELRKRPINVIESECWDYDEDEW